MSSQESTYITSSHPLYVMAKPAGPACNMHCDYCYYLEKSHLYPSSHSHLMSLDTLERFVSQYISCQTSPNVLFTWHGGEPLLQPISFYEQALTLQQKYANGRTIDNVIQTNGTLINDQWARFFSDHEWLVGVSIDGPRNSHDAYRHLNNNQSSFDATLRGIDLLNKHNVMWNAMATVNHINVQHPLGFYNFFKEIGCHYIQFTPVVERLISTPENSTHLASLADTANCHLTPFSITPNQWGEFLCSIFDEWLHNDVGDTFVQIFDATLANWVGVEPGVCSLSRHCGHVAALEHNGDVYSCDHFVFPTYKLGNITQDNLISLLNSPLQQHFSDIKSDLPLQCKKCQWLFLCNGECPRNRFITTPDGQHGLNYLCSGYQRFFSHSAPYMALMKDLVESGHDAADIMTTLQKPPLHPLP